MFYFSNCLDFQTVKTDHISLGFVCFPVNEIFLFPVGFRGSRVSGQSQSNFEKWYGKHAEIRINGMGTYERSVDNDVN
jgi:hypothetical protein